MCSLYSLDRGASQVRPMIVVLQLRGCSSMLLEHCFIVFVLAIITCFIAVVSGKLWSTLYDLI